MGSHHKLVDLEAWIKPEQFINSDFISLGDLDKIVS
jgi:hypothetical protein